MGRKRKVEIETEAPGIGGSFRDKADSDTVSYLREIQQQLATIEDVEERSLLVNNVLGGLNDIHSTVAVDATCTRILEPILREAGVETLLKILGGLNQGTSFYDVASNPYGSHFIENVLKALESKPEADLEAVLSGIVEYVKTCLYDFLVHRYATHVIRRLICVLCGRDVIAKVKGQRNIGHSQADRKDHEHKQDEELAEMSGYPQLFRELVMVVCGGDYGCDAMADMGSSPDSAPTLQAMLYACETDQELLRSLVFAVLGAQEGNFDAEWLTGAMQSRHCSHLVEVAFKVAPQDVLSTLLESVMFGNLLTLSMHPCANFAVQAFADSLKQPEEVSKLIAELGPNFGTLFKSKRPGVVLSVLKASGNVQSDMKEVCKHLSEALQSVQLNSEAQETGQRQGIVEKLLCLGSSVRLGENGASGRLSTLGCIMLSTVLTYPQACNNAFLSGLMRVGAKGIQQMAKDKGGSRVLETIIQNDYKPKIKNQIMKHMDGGWAQIACTGSGSHLVEKCFMWGNMSQKEGIAEALVKAKQEISSTAAGYHLLVKCRIQQFENDKEGWSRRMERAKHQVKNFLQSLDIEVPAAKVGSKTKWQKRKADDAELTDFNVESKMDHKDQPPTQTKAETGEEMESLLENIPVGDPAADDAENPNDPINSINAIDSDVDKEMEDLFNAASKKAPKDSKKKKKKKEKVEQVVGIDKGKQKKKKRRKLEQVTDGGIQNGGSETGRVKNAESVDVGKKKRKKGKVV